jgi:hypothetical protein
MGEAGSQRIIAALATAQRTTPAASSQIANVAVQQTSHCYLRPAIAARLPDFLQSLLPLPETLPVISATSQRAVRAGLEWSPQ